MSKQSHLQPTPYPEANNLLQYLLIRVQETLSTEFVGLYIHGSLAAGDFNPVTSDIDFFVVTQNTLPEKVIDALADMHHDLETTGLAWLAKLEGSYVPLAAMRYYDPGNCLYPRYDYHTKLHLCGHGSDQIIQYSVLRENGLVLAGPTPQSFMEAVPADDIRQASLSILEEWWLPQMEDTARLAQPGYEAYAILTMCRILYSLETGKVASKSAAAHWAQDYLLSQWTAHIQRAMTSQGDDILATIPQTVSLIGYVYEYSQTYQLD